MHPLKLIKYMHVALTPKTLRMQPYCEAELGIAMENYFRQNFHRVEREEST